MTKCSNNNSNNKMRNKNNQLIRINKGFNYLTREKTIVMITRWKVNNIEINMKIVCFK